MKTSHPTNSQSTFFEKALKVIIAILVFAALSLQFFALTSCSKNDDAPTPPVAENPIAISSIGPNTGPKNTAVVITGIGFSPNATSNLVTLNGKTCTVVQASSTQLNIVIPPAAGTGNIKVTVNGFNRESNTFTFIDTVTVSTLAGSTQGFADGQGTTARFDFPEGVAVDATGNVYVTDRFNHKIRKITPTGVVSTFAGSTLGFAEGQGVAAQFNNLQGLTIDASGNLYVSDSENHKIRKISPTGLVSTLAGSTAGFADGQGTAAQFKSPAGLTVDVTGNLYVADAGNHKIRKISPTGVVTTIAGSTRGFADGQGTAAQFNFPLGITIDPSGNLYIVDARNDKIRKITSTGLVSTIAGSTTGFADGQGIVAQFSFPFGITIDALGNLYVVDAVNNKIRKIISTGLVSTIAGGSIGFADGIGTNARFKTPLGITIDQNGVLYVSEENHKIRKIVID